MVQAVSDAQGGDDHVEPGGVGSGTRQAHREKDVGAGVQGGNQVEGLEHEANAVAPQLRQRGVIQGRDVGPLDVDAPGGGGVETGENVHHRRLAGSGGTHDCGELTGAEADGHVDEGAHLGVSLPVELGDGLKLNDRHGLPALGRRVGRSPLGCGVGRGSLGCRVGWGPLRRRIGRGTLGRGLGRDGNVVCAHVPILLLHAPQR